MSKKRRFISVFLMMIYLTDTRKVPVLTRMSGTWTFYFNHTPGNEAKFCCQKAARCIEDCSMHESIRTISPYFFVKKLLGVNRAVEC